MIGVMGIGSLGCQVIGRMTDCTLRGVSWIGADSCRMSLRKMPRVAKRIELGERITRGLSTGANVCVGELAVRESRFDIEEALKDVKAVILVGGLGGGTASGGMPVIAEIARGLDISLVAAIVTLPFRFEGEKRMRVAEQALARIRKGVDSAIVLPLENLLRLKLGESDPSERVLMTICRAVDAVVDPLAGRGHRVHDIRIEDLHRILHGSMEAYFSFAGADGAEDPEAAIRAVEAAWYLPLLPGLDREAPEGLLVTIKAGRWLSLDKAQDAIDALYNVSGGARICHQVLLDDLMRQKVVVTLVRTTPRERVQDRKIRP
jgi:cell division protein FtsZ